jgi:hypothetical protein
LSSASAKSQLTKWDSTRIADEIRNEFPETAKETDMGIASILSDLAVGLALT